MIRDSDGAFLRRTVHSDLATLAALALLPLLVGAQELEAQSVPDWMQVDRKAETVQMEIIAGKTDANNNWNFNGYASGNARITVPRGYEITIDFVNQTENLVAHSLGIDETMESWPATFQKPEPVFEGAITSNPTSMADGTQPGESETIVFTASESGEYTMVCYIPGHATAGMWIYFTVSGEGDVGFTKLN